MGAHPFGGERRRRIVSPDAVRALRPSVEPGLISANRDLRRVARAADEFNRDLRAFRGSIREFVARERPRVEVWPDDARMVLQVRVHRADGTVRAVAATYDSLAESRGDPVEVFAQLLAGDDLDQLAVSLIARQQIAEHTGPTTYRNTLRSWRPIPVREPPWLPQPIEPRGEALAPANPDLPFYRPK